MRLYTSHSSHVLSVRSNAPPAVSSTRDKTCHTPSPMKEVTFQRARGAARYRLGYRPRDIARPAAMRVGRAGQGPGGPTAPPAEAGCSALYNERLYSCVVCVEAVEAVERCIAVEVLQQGGAQCVRCRGWLHAFLQHFLYSELYSTRVQCRSRTVACGVSWRHGWVTASLADA